MDQDINMSNQIKFFIDGKQTLAAKSELTVAEILGSAKIPIDEYYLVSEKGDEYKDPTKEIKLYSGERFQTRKRDHAPSVIKKIYYSVNGEAQMTERNPLTVETILKNAGAAASIDVAQIDSYYLESIENDQTYNSLADQVTIQEGDRFLAVYRGKTPVA